MIVFNFFDIFVQYFYFQSHNPSTWNMAGLQVKDCIQRFRWLFAVYNYVSRLFNWIFRSGYLGYLSLP